MSENVSSNPEKRIVIFASGSGTNAQNIIRYFKQRQTAKVVIVLSNRRSAPVLERAADEGVDAVAFTRDDLYENGRVERLISSASPDIIVLAGFLLKFPDSLVKMYGGKVINIHPALLPKYGGKGMYGRHVHEAVITNREKESGITIHYVNEHYDEGAIIFQKSIKLNSDETPDSLASRIHELEYKYFPVVVEKLLAEGNDQLSLPMELDVENG
jgi:phosphoribosylglycinamide formyltransferase-1